MINITKIDYLDSNTLYNLSQLVNKAIEAGWQPLGAIVYYEIEIYKEAHYVQAVAQYEQSKIGDGLLFKTVDNPGWETLTVEAVVHND